MLGVVTALHKKVGFKRLPIIELDESLCSGFSPLKLVLHGLKCSFFLGAGLVGCCNMGR